MKRFLKLGMIYITAITILLNPIIALSVPIGTTYRIKFVLEINGVPLEGESLNTRLGILKNSTHQWFDFDDETFKDSGWNEPYTIMAESIINTTFPYYYFDWDIPSTEINTEIYTFAVRTVGDQKVYKMQDISYYNIVFKAR